MFILIRTIVRHTDGTHEGRILSRHRTAKGAAAADDRLQRNIKRQNGQSSYLPTVIGEWSGRAPGVGAHVRDVTPVQVD